MHLLNLHAFASVRAGIDTALRDQWAVLLPPCSADGQAQSHILRAGWWLLLYIAGVSVVHVLEDSLFSSDFFGETVRNFYLSSFAFFVSQIVVAEAFVAGIRPNPIQKARYRILFKGLILLLATVTNFQVYERPRIEHNAGEVELIHLFVVFVQVLGLCAIEAALFAYKWFHARRLNSPRPEV